MGINLFKLLLISFIVFSRSVFAAVFYVDGNMPDDTGDGLSWDTAKKYISSAISLMDAGDELVVRSGVYSGTQNRIYNVPSGYSDSKTIIRGESLGQVILDGEWNIVPVEIDSDNVEIKDLIIKRGNVNALAIEGEYISAKRIGIMSVSHSRYAYPVYVAGQHCLLEDCFVWGSFRVGISVSTSNVTLRRCVVRQDAGVYYSTSPRASYGIRFYNQNVPVGGIVENCIVIDSTPYVVSDVNAAYRVKFYMSGAHLDFYGCIAMNLDEGAVWHGWYMEGYGHNLLNCIAYNGEGYAYRNDGQYSSGPEEVTATNCTGIRFASGFLKSNGFMSFYNERRTQDGLNYLPRREESIGAQIFYRYVDGQLTDEPIWPFPNEDLIKNQMRQADVHEAYPDVSDFKRGFCADGAGLYGGRITLTSYIWEYLGNPCPVDVCNYYDVNRDGHVNISDVQLVVNHILGNSSSEHADTTGDGSVTIQDVQGVVNVILAGTQG